MLRDAIMEILQRGAVSIPAFSGTATKLRVLLKDPNVDLNKVAEIIKSDPGLTAQYLRAVKPEPGTGKKTTGSIIEALSSSGLHPVRQQALGINTLGSNHQNNSTKGDWKSFWPHSVFTARLTELIGKAYRPTTGREYLAGLMHDSGKAFLEHYFPQEFETVIFQATASGCAMHEIEQKILGVTHAEISAIICEKLNLHREIVRAVRFHHEPDSPFNKDPANLETERFLAACLCVADSLANFCKVNIYVAKIYTDNASIENLPGWSFLRSFPNQQPLELNLNRELQETYRSIEMTRAAS